MPTPSMRVIVVEHQDDKRTALAERLRSQGYEVDALSCGVEAANQALAAPPRAVIADLWMPGVSGVQLCRLLRSEPATEHVPIVLRGDNDTPRQRFWAVRAGAAAYVAKGRMGELVRSLDSAIASAPQTDGFFQIHAEDIDIRDRVCQQLDAALYESVVASEVRALSTCDTFHRLFDLFSQFLCQVANYRWLAVVTEDPPALGVHARPDDRDRAVSEAREALQVGPEVPLVMVEDEDAEGCGDGPAPLTRVLCFGHHEVGRLAMAPTTTATEDDALIELVAGELGGPVRIVNLVAKTNLLASSDPLTGLMNRRAFRDRVGAEVSRAERMETDLSLLLLDIDHFKSINDTHGHATGDDCLREVGALLASATRDYDLCARWGGEEFVVALPQTSPAQALLVAERIRGQIEELDVSASNGQTVPLSVSIGVATRRAQEKLDDLVGRADVAMYEAKAGGRNRVIQHDAAPRLQAV